MLEDQWFDNGVVARKESDYKVTELPEAVGVNPSLLNAPIYVLNPSSASKINTLKVSWSKKMPDGSEATCTFKFSRKADTPFPTAVHAKYLDILLAMFAQDWNSEGLLRFRYCDVLRFAGKSGDDTDAIKQTIVRYHCHTTEWYNSWNGRHDTFTFNIIRKSSIFDEKGKLLNPRRSLTKETWHSVIFDQEIVNALRKENKRLFLTSVFQTLDTQGYCIYRYYYAYADSFKDDRGNLRSSITWRTLKQLSSVFKWTGRQSRFVPWLKDRFAALEALGLIDPPTWNGDAVGVHCRNLKDLLPSGGPKVPMVSNYEHMANLDIDVKGRVIHRDNGKPVDQPTAKIKNKRGASTKVKAVPLVKLSDQDVLTEYYARRAGGLVADHITQVIDLTLANQMKDAAINLIKSHVLAR
jgi:hypothetical protein